MRRGLRRHAVPRHRTGLLLVLCVLLSAAALLAASLSAGHARADDGTTALRVYFNKEGLGEGDAACSQVAAVVREVPRTQGVARAALQELFRGPTPAERSEGYRSWFSQSTRSVLKDVRIADRTAYVDLHDLRQIIPGASSSCGSAEFFAQVEATLKQFPTVERVILAIEGQPRLFYDWMEMECAEANDYCDATPFGST
jgi:spore germination protein GerM